MRGLRGKPEAIFWRNGTKSPSEEKSWRKTGTIGEVHFLFGPLYWGGMALGPGQKQDQGNFKNRFILPPIA